MFKSCLGYFFSSLLALKYPIRKIVPKFIEQKYKEETLSNWDTGYQTVGFVQPVREAPTERPGLIKFVKMKLK